MTSCSLTPRLVSLENRAGEIAMLYNIFWYLVYYWAFTVCFENCKIAKNRRNCKSLDFCRRDFQASTISKHHHLHHAHLRTTIRVRSRLRSTHRPAQLLTDLILKHQRYVGWTLYTHKKWPFSKTSTTSNIFWSPEENRERPRIGS